MSIRVVSALLAAATAAGALAAGAPAAPLTSADKQAIGAVVDTFIKDAVRRDDLAASWRLAGPNLRGGTTRKAWTDGSGVTVPYFPAAGDDFTHAWTGHLTQPGHAELTVILHPKDGSGYDQTAATVDLKKIRGRWLVDLFYAAATFRPSAGHTGSCASSSCSISGPNDFLPGASVPAAADGQRKVGPRTLLTVLLAVAAGLLIVPVTIWLRLRLRTRKAWAAYHSAHGHPVDGQETA